LTFESAPKCLLLIWLAPQFQEILSKPVAQPRPPAGESSSMEETTAPPSSSSSSSQLFLSLNLSELEFIFFSKEFTILAGPASDCQLPLPPTALPGAGGGGAVTTERQKFVSNSSNGYSSWNSLRFNLWDEEMGSDCVLSLTSLSLLELTVARDYYRSILRFFEPFIRDDGTRVGSINLLYQHLLSVEQFFSPHSSSSSTVAAGGKGGDVKIEYLLMETLILLLLQPPFLNSNLIQRIILELCSQSVTIPPILASGLPPSSSSCSPPHFLPSPPLLS
jgi:hypothetical protein